MKLNINNKAKIVQLNIVKKLLKIYNMKEMIKDN